MTILEMECTLFQRAKEKLVQLTANEIRHKLDTGKIPVITGVRCRPLSG
jgi:hypothetical protein